MFSAKLIEYLKSTNEEKQALDLNLRKQYDFQIREKVEEAISHFKLMISSHSEDQLKKIFNDDQNKDLLKITEKALETADFAWREKLSKKLAETKPEDRADIVKEDIERVRPIREHYQTIEKYVLQPSEINERDRLLDDYLSYAGIKSEIEILEKGLNNSRISYNKATNYLKEKGLMDEFLSYRRKPFIETFIESLKKKGWAEKKIDEIKAAMNDSIERSAYEGDNQ